MAESQRDELMYCPKKGPPLSSLKRGILDLLYDNLAECPKGSIRWCSIERTIAFILRKNCNCPEDSIHCICGGGFGSGC